MSSRVNSEFWASAATGRDIRAPLPPQVSETRFEAYLESIGMRDIYAQERYQEDFRRDLPELLEGYKTFDVFAAGRENPKIIDIMLGF